MSRRVEKPWGYEIIWAEGGSYVGKVLVIEAGHRLSLQYHQVKDETILVLDGTLLLHTQSGHKVNVEELGEGENRHVPPGLVHRYEAGTTRVRLVEVSTPELDDVVRLEDDFGRQGTATP
jgi:quercetin dioxygenase-like cupin family protein